MSPQSRRFLPLILVAAIALFVVPSLLSKKKSTVSSAETRATQTIEVMNLIDKGEQSYKAKNGGFTSHLADLVPLNARLADDLALGITVTLDVSSDGKRYVAKVESDVLRLIRARGEGKLAAQSCRIVKSGKGVKCPTPAATVTPAAPAS
jgi:hypothetical protein